MKKTLLFLTVFGIIPNFICESSLAHGIQKKNNPKLWSTSNPFKTDVFVENLGQFDNWAITAYPIKYAVNNSDRIFFTQNGLTLLLVKPGERTEKPKEASKGKVRGEKEQRPASKSYFVNMEWEGCNENPVLEVSEKSEAYYT